MVRRVKNVRNKKSEFWPKHPSCVEEDRVQRFRRTWICFFTRGPQSLPYQCCCCLFLLTGSVSPSGGGRTRRLRTLTSVVVGEFKTSASGSDFHLSSSKLQEKCRSVSAGVSEAAARVFIVNTDIKLSRQTEDEDEEDVKVCMFLQPGCPPVWPGAETAAGVTHF